MGHPLDGCWAKIARANQQLDALEADIDCAPNYGDAVVFRQEFDPAASTLAVTIASVPKLPLEWGLAAADPMQNLRAAINYLAWELAKWNLHQQGLSRNPVTATQFPISTKPREFYERMVADIHADHQALIRAVQPNGAGWMTNWPEHVLHEADARGLAEGHPLAVLARLTNIDKHQPLQPALAGVTAVNIGPYEPTDCNILDGRATLNLILEEGAHWVTYDIAPTGPEPRVKVEPGLTCKVQFSGGDINDLKWVASSVRNIVRLFERTFK
jgi:hypothetical protein